MPCSQQGGDGDYEPEHFSLGDRKERKTEASPKETLSGFLDRVPSKWPKLSGPQIASLGNPPLLATNMSHKRYYLSTAPTRHTLPLPPSYNRTVTTTILQQRTSMPEGS